MDGHIIVLRQPVVQEIRLYSSVPDIVAVIVQQTEYCRPIKMCSGRLDIRCKPLHEAS